MTKLQEAQELMRNLSYGSCFKLIDSGVQHSVVGSSLQASEKTLHFHLKVLYNTKAEQMLE